MPALPPSIVEAEARAWNYWFVDGLTNLVVGVNTLLISACILFPPRWPPKLLPFLLWGIGLFSYVVVAARYQQLVEWLKARTTYPRTGYVESPMPNTSESANLVTMSLGPTGTPPELQLVHAKRRRTWVVSIVLVIVACIAFVLIQARWVFGVAGLLFSIATALARRTFRFSWILPIGFPLLGFYISAFVPRHIGPDYFIVGMGLLFVLDGTATLIRYLIRNPKSKVLPR
jgi:hypothetical protein